MLWEHTIIIQILTKSMTNSTQNSSIISSKIFSSFLNDLNHNTERQRAMWHT